VDSRLKSDVLLELDVNLLKSEIGIMAFGKRMRIANAIIDLRRPPSIEYSDHQLSPTIQLHHSLTQFQLQNRSHSHSRTQSQPNNQSHRSGFPRTPPPTNPASTSRRLFSRSHESTLSIIHSSPHSKASSLPSSIDDDILISIPHYPTHVSHSSKLLKSMAYHWQRRERLDWTAATAPTVYSSHSLLTLATIP
jgi:hypothetical protein